MLVEMLSRYDKATLLLAQAKKGDQEIVRLLAETRDTFKALQYFKNDGSWKFIHSLKQYRPEEVAIALRT